MFLFVHGNAQIKFDPRKTIVNAKTGKLETLLALYRDDCMRSPKAYITGADGEIVFHNDTIKNRGGK